MKSSTYYMGNDHSKYGIWNKQKKEFQFGICEDTSPKRSGSSFYDSPIWTTMRMR